MADKIRTRFAPSPTGRMHVGNLRTALYAYLIDVFCHKGRLSLPGKNEPGRNFRSGAWL